jgi:hypothetical protein
MQNAVQSLAKKKRAKVAAQVAGGLLQQQKKLNK